mgnify:CR=1 FL=1
MDIGIGNAQTLGPARMASSPVAATPVLAAAVAKPEEGEREASAVSVSAKAGETNGEQIEEAVTSIQNFVQTIRRDLNFSLDDSSGRVVVKVTDSASGEVIRQLPSEEALRLAESLEEVRSLLFKAEA